MNDITNDKMSIENITGEVGAGLDGMEKFIELIPGDDIIGEFGKQWMEGTLIIIDDGISELLDGFGSVFASTEVNTKFIGRNTKGSKTLKVINDGPRIPHSSLKVWRCQTRLRHDGRRKYS